MALAETLLTLPLAGATLNQRLRVVAAAGLKVAFYLTGWYPLGQYIHDLARPLSLLMDTAMRLEPTAQDAADCHVTVRWGWFWGFRVRFEPTDAEVRAVRLVLAPHLAFFDVAMAVNGWLFVLLVFSHAVWYFLVGSLWPQGGGWLFDCCAVPLLCAVLAGLVRL